MYIIAGLKHSLECSLFWYEIVTIFLKMAIDVYIFSWLKGENPFNSPARASSVGGESLTLWHCLSQRQLGYKQLHPELTNSYAILLNAQLIKEIFPADSSQESDENLPNVGQHTDWQCEYRSS